MAISGVAKPGPTWGLARASTYLAQASKAEENHVFNKTIVATHPASNLLTELSVSSNSRPLFKHRAFNIN